jgi:hypothetical protein
MNIMELGNNKHVMTCLLPHGELGSNGLSKYIAMELP